jgi:mxaJ protein
MYLRFLNALAATLFVAGIAQADPLAGSELRVCADPQNLPYSRDDGSGFENRIVAAIASELGMRMTLIWLPEGRGYVRKTLNAGLCDIIAGVPERYDPVRTTAPYYRSSYVFVSRADAGEPYRSFDDARLTTRKIGVQLIGDDLAATPPAHALAARGIEVVGYTLYGEGRQVERMIADLAKGTIDVALAWGPQAGYFAARAPLPLTLSIAEAPPDLAQIPFVYSIAMGVRTNDADLQHALDAALQRARPAIDRILAEFAVPRIDRASPQAELAR